MVIVLHPAGEVAVECVDAGEVERAVQKAFSDAAKEALDLSFRGPVAYGSMTQEASEALADLGDLLGGVDGAMVDVHGLGDAALVQSASEGLDEGVGVLGEKEFAMAANPAGVVDEGDELGLGVSVAVFDVGPAHGVRLPELIGVGLGKREPFLVLGSSLGLEQLVAVDGAAERVGSDLLAAQKAAFDATAIHRSDVSGLVVEVREHLFDSILKQLRLHLSQPPAIGTGPGFHRGDAVLLVAGVPVLNGAPGELVAVVVVVGEDDGADVADALDD